MFNKALNEMTLSSRMADNMFPNITAAEYNGDTSFAATLRALLIPRIGEGKINLILQQGSFRSFRIDHDFFYNYEYRWIDYAKSDTIVMYNFQVSDKSNDQDFFDALDDPENGFIKRNERYTALDAVSKALSSSVNIRAYSNLETRTTIVFVSRLNMRSWHLLQCTIPAIVRWYFTESKITEEEKKLLMSLNNRNSTDYERLIEEFASKFDFRTYMIDHVVTGFEKATRESQLNSMDNNIENIEYEIRSILDRYKGYIEQLDEYKVRRAGLAEMIRTGEGSTELTDYFRSNKQLDPVEVSGSHLKFIVRTYLDNYDPELYETMAKRPGSHLYHDYDTVPKFENAGVRKKFMDAIFSDDPILRVRMCAYYDLDIRGHVSSYSGYRYPNNCSDFIPNPHLQYHNCLGDHQRYINERLLAGDTIGAIAQCIASAQSMNLGEDVTVKYFFQELFTTKKKVIELPDGTHVSPEEALDWLNEQEKEA